MSCRADPQVRNHQAELGGITKSSVASPMIAPHALTLSTAIRHRRKGSTTLMIEILFIYLSAWKINAIMLHINLNSVLPATLVLVTTFNE